MHALEESRVLFLSCGTFGNVVRLVPPLVVSEEEVERAVAALDAALSATA